MAKKDSIEWAVQIWRWLVLAAIVWMVREHNVRVLVQGDRPITISEVRELLPDTHTLKPDGGERKGLTVIGKNREVIGYAARTMPWCRKIIGYSGPTDALMVLDAEDKVVGITIRHSYDTPSHVDDVKIDYLFMETWNGKTWDEVAEMQDLRASKVWGVSGATRTSEALAKSVAFRAAAAENTTHIERLQLRWQDIGLVVVTMLGLGLAFVKKPWLQRRKNWIHIAIFAYFVLLSGDMLAQSLLVGWAESGFPWRATPGLVLLALTAFLVPGTAKHPVYCTHICPHGHAQRWLMKVLPPNWKLRLHPDLKWSLRAFPAMLIALVLLTSFLKLRFDLAGIEPFDAYIIRSAGIATIAVAIASLVFSLFVPMGYCKYGCPTGAALEYVRRSRLGLKDVVGAGLLVFAAALYFGYDYLCGFLVL